MVKTVSITLNSSYKQYRQQSRVIVPPDNSENYWSDVKQLPYALDPEQRIRIRSNEVRQKGEYFFREEAKLSEAGIMIKYGSDFAKENRYYFTLFNEGNCTVLLNSNIDLGKVIFVSDGDCNYFTMV